MNGKQQPGLIALKDAELIYRSLHSLTTNLSQESVDLGFLESVSAIAKSCLPEGFALEALRTSILKSSIYDQQIQEIFKDDYQFHAHKTSTLGSLPIRKIELDHLLKLFQEKKYQECEVVALKLIRDNPREPLPIKILSGVYFFTNRIENACEAAKKVVRLCPKDVQSISNLGVILKNLGNLDEAEQTFRNALTIDPNNSEVIGNYANILMAKKKYDEAEKLYKKALTTNPEHHDILNNYAALLNFCHRSDEAENMAKKALRINPHSPSAMINLANSFQNMGRFTDAEEIYRNCISSNPSFAEAYNNLGNLYNETSRVKEGEAACLTAITLKNDYADAYSNLATSLRIQGSYFEAERNYRVAISFDKTNPEYRANLAALLMKIGRMEEAKKAFLIAVNLSNTNSIINNLFGLFQIYNDDLEAAIKSYSISTTSGVIEARYAAFVDLAAIYYSQGDVARSQKMIISASDIYFKISNRKKISDTYFEYLRKLIEWQKFHADNYQEKSNSKAIYFVGESHALSPSSLRISIPNRDFHIKSIWVPGCKQWHFATDDENVYKHKLKKVFARLPEDAILVLAIGEIDCRLDEGILVASENDGTNDFQDTAKKTVIGYLNYIFHLNTVYRKKIIVHGIPAPNLRQRDYNMERYACLIKIIKIMNDLMYNKSIELGFGFLDVYKMTLNSEGTSNRIWHLDEHHLMPSYLDEAVQNYLSGVNLENDQIFMTLEN